VGWRFQIEVIRHDMAVNPRDQVQALIHERNIAAWHPGTGYGNPSEQNPIANERSHEGRDLGAYALVPQVEETDE
jgi:hypothetical protein